MATPTWDFDALTTFTATIELIRGIYHSIHRQDQLYIWIRTSDAEKLAKHAPSWLSIEESQESGYHVTKVTIKVQKSYPMSILLKTGSEDISELNISEMGNIAVIEQARVTKLNEGLASDQKYSVNFGKMSVKDMDSALDLGRKLQRHIRDMDDLEYTMISTVKSGLITEDLF